MSETTELKPCPFCSSPHVNDTTAPDAILGLYSWVCPDCFATGPACKTPEEATEDWNRRAPDRVSDAMVESGSRAYARWWDAKGTTEAQRDIVREHVRRTLEAALSEASK